jgi:thiol-disulfide isomerase/thioredoxin
MKTVSVFCIILLAASCNPVNKEHMLPSFDILLIDSVTHLNTSAIKRGSPIILVYFSPDCVHCQEETESLLKNMDSLKNVRFYFVTNDPFERLQVFNGFYKIYKYPNIILGRDYNFFLLKYLKPAIPPFTVIYDGSKRVRVLLKGEAKASEIIKFVDKL